MQTKEAVRDRPKEAKGFQVNENGGLIRVDVAVTGLTPLLMNAMSMETLLKIRSGSKSPKTAAKPSLEEEAHSKLHLLPDGRPRMPANALYASWMNAGQFVRLDGKRQVSTQKSTVLPGMLHLEDTDMPLHVPGKDKSPTWEVDIQQGRNPNGGEAVCIVRPRFDEWELRFTIEVDQNQMPIMMAMNLISIAGKRIGVLDARPQRRGLFGQFAITKWEPKSSG